MQVTGFAVAMDGDNGRRSSRRVPFSNGEESYQRPGSVQCYLPAIGVACGIASVSVELSNPLPLHAILSFPATRKYVFIESSLLNS